MHQETIVDQPVDENVDRVRLWDSHAVPSSQNFVLDTCGNTTDSSTRRPGGRLGMKFQVDWMPKTERLGSAVGCCGLVDSNRENGGATLS